MSASMVFSFSFHVKYRREIALRADRDRAKNGQRKQKRSLKGADFYFLFLQKSSWHTLLQFGMGGCSAQCVSLLRSPESSCWDLYRSPHICSLMDSLEDKLTCFNKAWGCVNLHQSFWGYVHYILSTCYSLSQMYYKYTIWVMIFV